MSAPQVRGITGLLDGILSSANQTNPERPKDGLPKKTACTASATASIDTTAITPVRRGRPPGTLTPSGPKMKLTVRVTGSLISHYRNWTWEARCQLSHLVENALADYYDRHRSRNKGRTNSSMTP